MPISAFVFDAYGTLFDTNSVLPSVEACFPGFGDYVTQVWRQKQLEYTWQRATMSRYAGFEAVTREALLYAVRTIGADPADAILDALCATFDSLDPFPDAEAALTGLEGYRLSILSNGSPRMLATLLSRTRCDRFFDPVISTEGVRSYKPHPDAYRSAVDALGFPPSDIALVSSNGFDIAGAKSFGLGAIRIARTPARALQHALADTTCVEPRTMFSALRSQPDALAGAPDFCCSSLTELVALAASIAAASPETA